MASHKRRGHLDKPTRDHLIGIEAALQAMCPRARQEGEFTGEELFHRLRKQGNKCTIDSIRQKLNRMTRSGQCERRKVNLDGHMTNLYRMVSPDSAPHGG
jgi:hypothetical protein